MGFHKKIRYGNILAKKKIILIGDDNNVARQLGKIFKNRDILFNSISNESDVIGITRQNRPDLVIIDLTDLNNSIEICGRIKYDRIVCNMPLIILGYSSSNRDATIKCLSAGADDFITKPIDKDLFIAKLNSIIRRSDLRQHEDEIIKASGIEINLTAHTVKCDDIPVKLTPMEFALLYFLIKRKGQVLSRKTLTESVWEQKYFKDMRTVNTHIQNTRKKLGKYGKNIESVEGIGYKFVI
ncbi:response regulator transcription factor [Elusimicrobiota bacterium]